MSIVHFDILFTMGSSVVSVTISVSTIEHVLAALVGLEIDNVLIDMDGPETPIMDGSSIQFVEAIRSAGFTEQEADREYAPRDGPMKMAAIRCLAVPVLPVQFKRSRK